MKYIYLAAVIGRPKEVLEAWRDELNHCKQEWNDLALEMGAVQSFSTTGIERPTHFAFAKDEDIPANFYKPRKGKTCPNRREKVWAPRIEALPQMPSIDSLATDLGLPLKLVRKDGKMGFCSIAYTDFYVYSPAWWDADAPVCLRTKDFRTMLTDPSEHDKLWFGDDIGNWAFDTGDGTIPDGFTIMTQAEIDLKFAEAKVKREKEAVEKEAMAALSHHALILHMVYFPTAKSTLNFGGEGAKMKITDEGRAALCELIAWGGVQTIHPDNSYEGRESYSGVEGKSVRDEVVRRVKSAGMKSPLDYASAHDFTVFTKKGGDA